MLDPKIVEDLKAKHGPNLCGVKTRDGAVLVFKRPSRQEYDRWFDTRDKAPSSAARELAQACLVYPERNDMIAALEAQPALLMCKGGISDAITDLAGLDQETELKKL
jgi:hypothetical protein